MKVKVVKYLPKSEAVVNRYSQSFTENAYSLVPEVAGLQPKNRLHQICFHVSLSNISELFFCEARLGGDCFC